MIKQQFTHVQLSHWCCRAGIIPITRPPIYSGALSVSLNWLINLWGPKRVFCQQGSHCVLLCPCSKLKQNVAHILLYQLIYFCYCQLESLIHILDHLKEKSICSYVFQKYSMFYTGWCIAHCSADHPWTLIFVSIPGRQPAMVQGCSEKIWNNIKQINAALHRTLMIAITNRKH